MCGPSRNLQLIRNKKPIIGVIGGIGSGKSYVSQLFGELGSYVIDSDSQVRDAYRDPTILTELRTWWGDGIFKPDGSVSRSAIAAIVFANAFERTRLEQLLHPWVRNAREQAMATGANNPSNLAFIWDTPLLLETGLDQQCDVVVFVDCPLEVRLKRVSESRGWDLNELNRRENLQTALDKKREIADYVVVNTAEADDIRRQVREILSRILANQ